MSSVESQKGVSTLFNDVPLRTRRALLPYSLYSDNILLVLNETSLNNINALLALNQRCIIVLPFIPLSFFKRGIKFYSKNRVNNIFTVFSLHRK